MANYISLDALFAADPSNFTMLRAETRDDDGTFSYPSTVDWLKYNGNIISTFYISSNSWIGMNGSSEHLKFNRRDAQSATFYRETGQLWNYKFLRIRWKGYSAYSSSYYGNTSYLMLYDWVFFDTGDICLHVLNAPVNSYDGSFNIVASTTYSYTKPTNDSYVTFYTQNENNSVFTVANERIKIESPFKYLVKSENDFYTIEDSALVSLGPQSLSAQLFKDYGFKAEAIDESLFINLSSPTFFVWSNIVLPSISVNLTATPFPQYLYAHVDATHESIAGIQNITDDIEGNPFFAISIDNKTTWEEYSNGSWSACESYGMTLDTLKSISTEEWEDKLGDNRVFDFRITFTVVTDKIKSLVFNYINVDKEV